MLLYHGSNLAVEKPQILIPNRYLNFGKGFYTTSNLEQAINFAQKVTARNKSGQSTVSVYRLEDDVLDAVKVCCFETADEAWLDFVAANRSGIQSPEQYDIIIGPVADDDIFRTFVLYTNGVLSKQQTLDALKVKKLFNQYVFATEKALSYLQYIGTENG